MKHSQRWLIAAILAMALVAPAGCANKAEEEPKETPKESSQPDESSADEPTPTAAPESPGQTEDVTELKIEDLVVGTGAEAKSGDLVTVHYTGWLTDGTKFDSSLDGGQPFQFTLGAGQVITGWDEGVAGMKIGGKRKLTVPPDMGYGADGYPGAIPGNATLVFEVELLGVN